MNTSTDPTANSFKYTAKELSLFRGLPVYDYTARHTLPALGNTFRTMDPYAEKYVGISPFAFCGGDPINNYDPTGMNIEAIINNIKYEYCRTESGAYAFMDADGNQYAGGDVFGDNLVDALDLIQTGKVGQEAIKYLVKSDKVCTIQEDTYSNCKHIGNGNASVGWTGNGKSEFTGYSTNEYTPTFGMDLAHELGHTLSYFSGTNDESVWYTYNNGETEKAVSRDDIFACRFENFVRAENSLPLRTYYSGYEQDGILYPHPQSFVLQPINIAYDIICNKQKSQQ